MSQDDPLHRTHQSMTGIKQYCHWSTIISTHIRIQIYASLVQRCECKPAKIKHFTSNVVTFICYILYDLLSILLCHTQHMESSPLHPKTLAIIFATFCTILITEYEKVQQFLFQIQLGTNHNTYRRAQFGTLSYDTQVNHFQHKRKENYKPHQ